MAKIEIVKSLFEDIKKKFNGKSHKIIDLMENLEQNPNKGKLLGNIAGILIKEIRYNSFRFYFITNGYKLKFVNASGLNDILIRFIRISDKKNQQKIINEIKKVLANIWFDAFN